ncbi:hypothetical protein CDAR_178281 [Caerostris darwini]|uniref:Uncharacterized protein n=1 Tax=Caerostris darwini TaxID=1538125 RepID=A0AAV4W2A0_9ARAC|nr:hypothetical protein CDAR_178281 [Caerostris darwini]
MEKLSDLSPGKIGEISGSPKANRMSQYEKGSTVGVSRSLKKHINLMDMQKNRDIRPRNGKMSKRMLTEYFKDRSIEVSQCILLTEFDLMPRKPYRTPKLTLVMIKKRLE